MNFPQLKDPTLVFELRLKAAIQLNINVRYTKAPLDEWFDGLTVTCHKCLDGSFPGRPSKQQCPTN